MPNCSVHPDNGEPVDAKGLCPSPFPKKTIRPSQASAVYSGGFCLLALRGARDWRRGESIQLQDLEDHHIFPCDYLRNHGMEKRAVVNSIANRTLISDETNGKIKSKAPADYLANKENISIRAR